MKRLALALVLLLALAGAATADWTKERPEGATVAGGTARVLAGEEFGPPALDMTVINGNGDVVDVDTLVDGPTFFFYYSASCPHCQAVAPEIAALAKRLEGVATFVGVGSGSNSVQELDGFTKQYGLPFASWKDYTRRFGRDNGARSTPQLYFVRPKEGGGFETLGEWRPFAGGLGLLAEIRALTLANQDPWTAFRPGEYHGSNACGACHEVELRSWALTHHSIAYWTLYERTETMNPECIGCHVTGWKREGGFELGDHGSHLADVTCEACHGPGGGHAAGTKGADARAACVGCHDPDHSVRFSVERGLPHVDHFAPDAMSPTTFAAARTALVEGKAPRPLTAFPEGKTLGDAACVDCHQKEVKAMRKGPHANTPNSKEESDSLVGCESCHGPGEQHVAAGGGKENIVGLGESCPVCILEAICTNCHTAEMDPDWDLDKRLDALPKHGKK